VFRNTDPEARTMVEAELDLPITNSTAINPEVKQAELHFFLGTRVEVYEDKLGVWQVGTIAYVQENKSSGIALMDSFTMERIQKNEQVRLIQGSEPSEIENSLVRAILKSANTTGKCRNMAVKYLTKQNTDLEAIACASKSLASKYPNLHFIEVIGHGEFGMVLHVTVNDV
jgi:hypothetical protein